MSGQLDLPGVRIAAVRYEPQATAAERFLAFHRANPSVLGALVRLSLDVLSRGRSTWSINGAFEVLRWSSLRTVGDDFKLNNDFRAFYARAIPLVEPRLVGFFVVRAQREPFPFTADEIRRTP